MADSNWVRSALFLHGHSLPGIGWGHPLSGTKDWMGPPALRYQGNVDGPFVPIRGPFPVQAPDKAPETCTWSTRSADRGSQVSALGVGLPSGTPFRCRHRIKHRKRAPGQRGLRVGANLLSRNLDGNQIAWKYRRCAGHADLLFGDGGKRQAGKCDCLLEFTSRPELALGAARESGHNSMCQNGLRVLLRATVPDRPTRPL